MFRMKMVLLLPFQNQLDCHIDDATGPGLRRVMLFSFNVEVNGPRIHPLGGILSTCETRVF